MRSVLVVDDDVGIVDALTATLRRTRGRVVYGARDPDVAREIALRERPEGAIVDGILGPGRRTGYELVAELKRELPRLRMWMLSGSATDEYRELALRAGAEDLFEKPPLYAELSRAMFGRVEHAPEDSMQSIKERHVEHVMRACEGNKSEAARCLGIERSTLQKNFKKLGR